jgi:hypothetical protein
LLLYGAPRRAPAFLARNAEDFQAISTSTMLRWRMIFSENRRPLFGITR